MNEALSNQTAPGQTAIDSAEINPAALDSAALEPATLELRDIHLPEPISWWPIAPGWWILLACLVLIIVGLFIVKKIYKGNQLCRDIKEELDSIKQRYNQGNNKVLLAKELSILLRRASISYYPEKDFAGLTGNSWLDHLDETNDSSSIGKKFQSDIGEILLTAPYLPKDASLDFDATSLIQLCESWLLAKHKKRSGRSLTRGSGS